MRIIEILKEAGHDTEDFNNRQRTVIQINKVLKMGVSIKIAPIRKVMVTKKGFEFNIKINGFGWTSRIHCGNDETEPSDVLLACAKFFQIDGVKKQIISEIQTPSKCCKCNGQGIIPAFEYYAQGICFDCGGTGMTTDLSVNIKKVIQ